MRNQDFNHRSHFELYKTITSQYGGSIAEEISTLDLKFGRAEFKSHPDRQLDLFSVSPDRIPDHACKIANWFVSGQLGFFTLLTFI